MPCGLWTWLSGASTHWQLPSPGSRHLAPCPVSASNPKIPFTLSISSSSSCEENKVLSDRRALSRDGARTGPEALFAMWLQHGTGLKSHSLSPGDLWPVVCPSSPSGCPSPSSIWMRSERRSCERLRGSVLRGPLGVKARGSRVTPSSSSSSCSSTPCGLSCSSPVTSSGWGWVDGKAVQQMVDSNVMRARRLWFAAGRSNDRLQLRHG